LNIDIPQLFGYFLAMVFSLSVHEWAHALAAKWRGDDTAERMGRLTVNPMAHLDPIGTVLLPLLGAIMKWPMIGWAKPVPVDPRRFSNPRVDHAIVAGAGPLSNFIMGFLCALALLLHQRYLSTTIIPGSFWYPLVHLLVLMLQLNAVLAIFNLIPLPPLDGSALLALLLPEEMAQRWEEMVAPYGFIILLVLVSSGAFSWIGALSSFYVHLAINVASLMVPGMS
jgi:Zn-dependent protease